MRQGHGRPGRRAPLFFDYVATGRLDVEVATRVIAGIAAGCKQAGAALVGGEMAEMPDLYAAADYDLAGFCVGVVEAGAVIDGRAVRAGDALIGVVASGPHANGYSLIWRLIEHREADLAQSLDGRTLAQALLLPARIYVRPMLNLIGQIPVRALAHITGGGLYENLPRVMPPDTGPSSTRAPGLACRSSTGSRARVPSPGARCTAPSTAASAWWRWSPSRTRARAIGSLPRSGETAWQIGTVAPFAQGHGERVVIERLPHPDRGSAIVGNSLGVPDGLTLPRGSTIPRMQVATGTVIAGKVVVEGLELAEGETVTTLTQEADEEVCPPTKRRNYSKP